MSASKGSRASGSAKESEHPKGDPELERMWAARPGDVSFRDMSRDEIEAMLLGRPLCEHFDLIFGTSTGAIIAALLACRH